MISAMAPSKFTGSTMVAPRRFMSAIAWLAMRMLSRSARVASIMNSRTTPRRLPARDFLFAYCRYATGFLAMRRRRHMIPRVGAGNDFEHRRGVLHGAAHRSAAVARK